MNGSNTIARHLVTNSAWPKSGTTVPIPTSEIETRVIMYPNCPEQVPTTFDMCTQLQRKELEYARVEIQQVEVNRACEPLLWVQRGKRKGAAAAVTSSLSSSSSLSMR